MGAAHNMCNKTDYDKSAMGKTFLVFVVSVLFIVTYACHLSMCEDMIKAAQSGGFSNVENLSKSECKMTIYGFPASHEQMTGNVRTTMYIAMWVMVMTLSFIGFGLLCFKCNMWVRRVYSILLFAIAGMLSVAEFWTMKNTSDHYGLNFSDNLDNAVKNEASNEALSLNFAIWFLQTYLLVNTGCDAWTEE